MQHRPAVGEIVLGQCQLLAGGEQLVAKRAKLPLQLIDDPVGGIALALDVLELRTGIANLALEAILLPPQAVALGADILEPAPTRFDVGLRGERCRDEERCQSNGQSAIGNQ